MESKVNYPSNYAIEYLPPVDVTDENYLGFRRHLKEKADGLDPLQHLHGHNMFSGMELALDYNEPWARIIYHALNVHTKQGRDYGFVRNAGMRAVQALAIQEIGEIYPDNIETVNGVLDTINIVTSKKNQYALALMMAAFGVLSNIADRGQVVVASSKLEGKNNISIASFGSSIGLLEKFMMLHTWSNFRAFIKNVLARDLYRYNPALIVDFDETIAGNSSPPINPVVDEVRSKRYRRLINGLPFNLKYALTIDSHVSPDDPLATLLATSSQYIREIADDRQVVNRAQKLANRHLKNMGHVKTDFTHKGHGYLNSLNLSEYVSHRLPSAPLKYDAIFWSYSLYQNAGDQKSLDIAIENGKSLAKDDGTLYALDSVEIGPDGSMVFSDPEDPFKAKLWVYKMAYPELGWQQYLTAESGRIKMFKPEESMNQLALGRTVLQRSKRRLMPLL